MYKYKISLAMELTLDLINSLVSTLKSQSALNLKTLFFAKLEQCCPHAD